MRRSRLSVAQSASASETHSNRRQALSASPGRDFARLRRDQRSNIRQSHGRKDAAARTGAAVARTLWQPSIITLRREQAEAMALALKLLTIDDTERRLGRRLARGRMVGKVVGVAAVVVLPLPTRPDGRREGRRAARRWHVPERRPAFAENRSRRHGTKSWRQSTSCLRTCRAHAGVPQAGVSRAQRLCA